MELKKSAIKKVLFCKCFAVGFKKIKSITCCLLLVVANTSKRKTVKNKSASMVAFFGLANVKDIYLEKCFKENIFLVLSKSNLIFERTLKQSKTKITVLYF